MADVNVPRSGSLGYKPKVRADRVYPDIDNWPEADEPAPLDFPTYKAGMTRVLHVDDTEGATQGQEVATPVTVLEAPPARVYGARFYTYDPNHGKQVMTEAWTESPSPELQRATDIPKDGNLGNLEDAKNQPGEIDEVRLLVHTQREMTGHGHPGPANIETGLGGDTGQQLETAEELIGTQISPQDVLDEGQYTDAVAVTKGKGMEGPVKRHGVTKLGHKTQKKRRKAGNVGPWHPDTLSWKIPLPGQEGFHNRTEINKRIFDIGDDPERAQRDGGYKHYGELESGYILVKGSVPGTTKRLVRVRQPIRKDENPGQVEVTHVDT